jgi:hypothetical protein
LESVLGATPQEFESLILRQADLRRRELGYFVGEACAFVDEACALLCMAIADERRRHDYLPSAGWFTLAKKR